jgi:acetolactate synthase-1/3 small subunit
MKQTIIASVEDKPGALSRVASLFRRRDYNAESLAVGHSEIPGLSRMTIVTSEEKHLRRNVTRHNLLKLINTTEPNVTDQPCVAREIALIKVNADGTQRSQVLDVAKIYRAHIVDVATETLIVEITGKSSKIDSIIGVLEPFGILEIMRTGKIAMTRGMILPRPKATPSFVSNNGKR